MAFSQEDAQSVKLRSDWWSTRAHNAPLGVRTKEYRKLVESIASYEKAAKSKRDPAPLLDEIMSSADKVREAVTRDRFIGVKKKNGGKVGVIIAALPLMGTSAGKKKHEHFFKALENLRGMCTRKEEGYVPPQYRV